MHESCCWSACAGTISISASGPMFVRLGARRRPFLKLGGSSRPAAPAYSPASVSTPVAGSPCANARADHRGAGRVGIIAGDTGGPTEHLWDRANATPVGVGVPSSSPSPYAIGGAGRAGEASHDAGRLSVGRACKLSLASPGCCLPHQDPDSNDKIFDSFRSLGHRSGDCRPPATSTSSEGCRLPLARPPPPPALGPDAMIVGWISSGPLAGEQYRTAGSTPVPVHQPGHER